MDQARAMVAAARACLGVPFAHQGRGRHGLDCLGLVLHAASVAGCHVHGFVPARLDQRDYGARPDVAVLRARLDEYLKPIDALELGALLLLKVDGRAQHLALVSDYPMDEGWAMVHAYAPARKVVEHRLDAHWQSSIAAMYRLPA